MISNFTNEAIRLTGLTKRYGGVPVVDDLSLTIDRGVTFGLLGPNGAGKSTTIKMLMGLTGIDSGEAIVLGTDVGQDPAAIKQRVGYVPELHHIYGWMRVGAVIDFCRHFYPTWNSELCGDMLGLFDLPQKKQVRHLSKGMLAKLGLLLAVTHEPKLLVLDEPTSGLDPIVRKEFLGGVLKSICRGDQTVLFSSHVIDDVGRLADTIGIMHAGRMLVNESVTTLMETSKRIRAVLLDGSLPQHKPDNTIIDRLDRREWKLTVSHFTTQVVDSIREMNAVDSVEVTDISLEDLFTDYIQSQRQSL